MSYSGLGAGSESVFITIPTRTLQEMLRSRGFEPGPIDGKWGSQTLAAVLIALRRQDHGISVKGGGTSVLLSEATWSEIKSAVPPVIPATIRHLPASRIPSKPMDDPALTEGGTEWVPWAVGSVALLGAAGFVMWTGRSR